MTKIWVIGSPRSGTSFLTDFIGRYTDYCFNEPWGTYPLGCQENWLLPKGSFVFKYCANCFHYRSINRLFPDSVWIHIMRDPIAVLYSMFYPKEDSFPYRDWCELGVNEVEEEQKLKILYNKWKSILEASLAAHRAHLVFYDNLTLDQLSFLNLPFQEEDFNFQNRNDVVDEIKIQYLISLMKKIDIYDYVKQKQLYIQQISKGMKLYF